MKPFQQITYNSSIFITDHFMAIVFYNKEVVIQFRREINRLSVRILKVLLLLVTF